MNWTTGTAILAASIEFVPFKQQSIPWTTETTQLCFLSRYPVANRLNSSKNWLHLASLLLFAWDTTGSGLDESTRTVECFTEFISTCFFPSGQKQSSSVAVVVRYSRSYHERGTIVIEFSNPLLRPESQMFFHCSQPIELFNVHANNVFTLVECGIVSEEAFVCFWIWRFSGWCGPPQCRGIYFGHRMWDRGISQSVA